MKPSRLASAITAAAACAAIGLIVVSCSNPTGSPVAPGATWISRRTFRPKRRQHRRPRRHRSGGVFARLLEDPSRRLEGLVRHDDRQHLVVQSRTAMWRDHTCDTRGCASDD